MIACLQQQSFCFVREFASQTFVFRNSGRVHLTKWLRPQKMETARRPPLIIPQYPGQRIGKSLRRFCKPLLNFSSPHKHWCKIYQHEMKCLFPVCARWANGAGAGCGFHFHFAALLISSNSTGDSVLLLACRPSLESRSAIFLSGTYSASSLLGSCGFFFLCKKQWQLFLQRRLKSLVGAERAIGRWSRLNLVGSCLFNWKSVTSSLSIDFQLEDCQGWTPTSRGTRHTEPNFVWSVKFVRSHFKSFSQLKVFSQTSKVSAEWGGENFWGGIKLEPTMMKIVA